MWPGVCVSLPVCDVLRVVGVENRAAVVMNGGTFFFIV